MKHRLIRFLTIPAVMLSLLPVQTNAAEPEQVTLTPPAAVANVAPVGALHLCLDSNMNGSILEVRLESLEGDLLYYRYPVYTVSRQQVDCPLIRDGIYRLTVQFPQADQADYKTDTYSFEVADPDPPYGEPEFEFTEHTVYFEVKPTLDSNVSTSTEPVLKNRRYFTEMHCSYARKAYSAGELIEDGTVNAKDATAMLRAAAAIGVNQDSGLTSLQLAQADINGDQKVNAKDATLVLSYSTAYAVGKFTGTALEYAASTNLKHIPQ